jgi:hypothetical protein
MADGTVVELGNGTGVIGGVREWDGGLTGVPVWNAEEQVDCRQLKVERNRKEEKPSCRCGCDLGDIGRSGAAPLHRDRCWMVRQICALGNSPRRRDVAKMGRSMLRPYMSVAAVRFVAAISGWGVCRRRMRRRRQRRL